MTIFDDDSSVCHYSIDLASLLLQSSSMEKVKEKTKEVKIVQLADNDIVVQG